MWPVVRPLQPVSPDQSEFKVVYSGNLLLDVAQVRPHRLMYPRFRKFKIWEYQMTTDLSSVKYMPVQPTGYPVRPPRKASSGGISLIVGFLALAGIIGTLGGAFGIVGQLGIDNMKTSQITASYKGTGHHAEVYRRTIEKRKKFSIVAHMHSGICILVGLGFLASCLMLTTSSRGANSFASTACFAAIFYNVLTIVLAWLMLPSFENIRGFPEEAASVALLVAIGITVLIGVVKMAIYGVIIAYMSSSGVKAIYEPQTHAV